MQYWKTTNPKTALEAINGAGCSLALLRKEDEIVAKAFLTYIITDLIESFNVGKTMDQMQVVFSVNGIQADYYFLKSDELKFIFEEAKKGRYGTMYDRIDAAVIFGWIDRFVIERTNIYIQKNEEEAKIHKLDKIPIAPEIAAQISKSIAKEVPKVAMDLVTPERRKRTPEEEVVDEIIREFEGLYRDKPRDSNETVRTIPYLGKNYTVSEFIEKRLEEIHNL